MKKATFLFSIAVFLFVLSGCTSNDANINEISDNYSECSCSGNIYNCDDFSSHREAQACYDKCGGISNDVHKLDRDQDGSACETL